MATYYVIDGMRVRVLKAHGYTMANHQMAFKWLSVDPVNRAVYTLQKDLWYRAVKNAWDRGSKNKPKVITMAETVDSVSKTSWKEIESEIPPVSF